MWISVRASGVYRAGGGTAKDGGAHAEDHEHAAADLLDPALPGARVDAAQDAAHP